MRIIDNIIAALDSFAGQLLRARVIGRESVAVFMAVVLALTLNAESPVQLELKAKTASIATNSTSPKPTPTPQFETPVWCVSAATTIILGGIFLVCICANILRAVTPPTNSDMSNPPDPSFPPPHAPPSSNNVAAAVQTLFTGSYCIPLTGTSLMDTNAASPTPYTNYMAMTFQVGNNLSGFTDLYRFHLWQSRAGTLLSVVDPAERPLWTSYAAVGHTNVVPLWVTSFTGPQRFYRMESKPSLP